MVKVTKVKVKVFKAPKAKAEQKPSVARSRNRKSARRG